MTPYLPSEKVVILAKKFVILSKKNLIRQFELLCHEGVELVEHLADRWL